MKLLVQPSAVAAVCARGGRELHRYAAFALVSVLEGHDHAWLGPNLVSVLSDPIVRVNGNAVAVPEGTFEINAPHVLLRFAGPVAMDWLRSLAFMGVTLHFTCPPFGACVKLATGTTSAQLRALAFLEGAVPYRLEHCARPLPPPLPTAPEHFDIVCFSREDRTRVEDELGKLGVGVLSRSSSKLRVRSGADAPTLRGITGVKLVDAMRTPVPLGLSLLDALGVATPPQDAALRGKGQTIAVADTGFDRGLRDDPHEDFRGRVRALLSWPANESWSEYVGGSHVDDGAADVHSGHGTHVAGLALGSGALSAGKFRGVAPDAQLVFQALEHYMPIRRDKQREVTSGFYLSGRPLDLRKLFSEAREHGARIHVNAWGDPARGAYTDDCYEADDFLRQNPDAVVLFAAGNDGADRDGNASVDAGSLYAPASAKNVIAVGATEGPSDGVGLRADWSAFDESGRRFANGALRSDRISGQPEHLAPFSSAGPSADGRIKPDLCAPGTNIAGPRSRATEGVAWGLASPLPHYMYWGGTSAAVGLAGGFFALLREAWTQRLAGIAPSGAALKALAILGAHPVLARAGAREESPHGAGFGRCWLSSCLPGTPGVQLIDEREPGLQSGELREYRLTLAMPSRLRAVLTWYDAPGEHLINDLDLGLLTSDGDEFAGNRPFTRPAATPDRVNNVERLDLDLPAGSHLLRVTAFNVPIGPQPFALALRCEGATLVANGDTEAGPPARRKIALSWIAGLDALSVATLAQSSLHELDDVVQVGAERLRTLLGARAELLIAQLLVIESLRRGPRPPAEVAGAALSELMSGAASAADFGGSERARCMPLLLLLDPVRWGEVRVNDVL